MESIKPKRFSEVYPRESVALVDALIKTTNHELFYCGKCQEPINTSDKTYPPKFCTKCGIEIDWSERYNDRRKSCSKCFIGHNFEDNYCRVCGSELKNPEEDRKSIF
ncbi:MAG: hypothetical protein KGI10_05905 [Thaumarchaeota archaeon]|nr:hypothetical protein [Nitrososphaerota archaeon]